LHLRLVAGIDTERADIEAGCFCLIKQALRFGGLAAGHANRVSASGKSSRHRRADRIARAHQQCHAVVRHRSS
jgi:hypothetical protein